MTFMALALCGTATHAQAPAKSMTCDDIALELVSLTEGTVSAAGRAQALSKKGQAPSMVQETLKNQALGAVLSTLPGPAAGAASMAVGMGEVAVEAKRSTERAAAEQELQSVEAGQEQRLERLLQLHEQHEARCAG